MPSMFPGFRNDPDDLNRQYRPSQRDLTGIPHSITWGYWLLVIIAILMVVAGAGLVLSEPPTGADPESVSFIRRNLVFVGVANLLGGVLTAMLAPQLRRGSRLSRRWLLAVVAVMTLINLLSFVLMREPFSLAVIAGLLMISGVVIFQPSATTYINRLNE